MSTVFNAMFAVCIGCAVFHPMVLAQQDNSNYNHDDSDLVSGVVCVCVNGVPSMELAPLSLINWNFRYNISPKCGVVFDNRTTVNRRGAKN